LHNGAALANNNSNWRSEGMTPESPKNLATRLLALYPSVTLKRGYESFSWKGAGLVPALAERTRIAESCPTSGCSADQVVVFFSNVNRWGFGRHLAKSLTEDPDFHIACFELFQAWKSKDRLTQEKSLTNIMGFKGLGIATASKFTAMVDSEYAAIYDSRVTSAMDAIKIEGRRVFPMVGRRPVKNKNYFKADRMTSDKSKRAELSGKYMLYLNVLTEVRMMTNDFTSNSEIEIALFMLGKDIQDVLA
jgi:hypothetical protein